MKLFIQALHQSIHVVSPPVADIRKILPILIIRIDIVKIRPRIKIIIQMDPVNLIILNDLQRTVDYKLAHLRKRRVKIISGPVLDHPVRMLSGRRCFSQTVPLVLIPGDPVGIEPCMQLYIPFMRLLHPVSQRIEFRIWRRPLLSGQETAPWIESRLVKRIRTRTHLQEHRVKTAFIHILKYRIRLVFQLFRSGSRSDRII